VDVDRLVGNSPSLTTLAGIKGLQARAAQIQPFSEWRDKAGAAPLDLPDGISRQRGGFTRALCAFVKLTPDISTS
jgi:hypothetical protein